MNKMTILSLILIVLGSIQAAAIRSISVTDAFQNYPDLKKEFTEKVCSEYVGQPLTYSRSNDVYFNFKNQSFQCTQYNGPLSLNGACTDFPNLATKFADQFCQNYVEDNSGSYFSEGNLRCVY